MSLASLMMNRLFEKATTSGCRINHNIIAKDYLTLFNNIRMRLQALFASNYLEASFRMNKEINAIEFHTDIH